MAGWQGLATHARGLRASVAENATAYGFSIMITGSLGVISSLEEKPAPWEIFLFVFGAVGGFTAVMAVATKGLRDAEGDVEKGEVELFAAFMNFFSVLGAVGAAAAVAWLAQGWEVWLTGPIASSATYVVLNGLEYALGEEREEREESDG